jgi:hypothetical protein
MRDINTEFLVAMCYRRPKISWTQTTFLSSVLERVRFRSLYGGHLADTRTHDPLHVADYNWE